MWVGGYFFVYFLNMNPHACIDPYFEIDYRVGHFNGGADIVWLAHNGHLVLVPKVSSMHCHFAAISVPEELLLSPH